MELRKPNSFQASRFIKWLLNAIDELTTKGSLKWYIVGFMAYLPVLFPIGLANEFAKNGGAAVFLSHAICAIAFGLVPVSQAFFSLNVRRMAIYDIKISRSVELSADDLINNKNAILAVCCVWFIFALCTFPIVGVLLSFGGFDWANPTMDSLVSSIKWYLILFIIFMLPIGASLLQSSVLSIGAKNYIEPIGRSIVAAKNSIFAMLIMTLIFMLWFISSIIWPIWAVLFAPLILFSVDLAVRDSWFEYSDVEDDE